MGILSGGTTVGERWCPPTWRWATSRLCGPPTKHVLRGWYIVYGGTDTYAGRIPLGWRYTCLLGEHVTTTAKLIHQLGGRHLWGDITLGRRYVWLNDTHLLYLGWLVLLLTWAIHTLVGATFEGDTHLLTITWAIHNLVGATLHTLKLLLLGRYISATSYLGDTHLGWRYIWGWYTSSYDYLGDTQLGRRYTSYTEASLTWAIHILFTDLKACLQISVHAFEKVYVTQGPLSSL